MISLREGDFGSLSPSIESKQRVERELFLQEKKKRLGRENQLTNCVK